MKEPASPMVYVVDGDSSVRRSMERLLLASHMNTKSFASIDEFLGSRFHDKNGCVIVDVNGMDDSSLELQNALAARDFRLPIIFMTTLDSSEVRDRLKRTGAVSYLRKPVDDQALLDTIRWALSNQA